MGGKPNWNNQTICTGDNLDVMRGMNSQTIDLIYLDPPFNSNKHYAAPIGSQAAGAEFKDTWNLDDVKLVWHGEIKHENPDLYFLLDAVRRIHSDSMMSYLIYMAIRLMEMDRLLKDTGNIWLHCDPTSSHYLKLLMDSIFGRKNMRNEVIWGYTGPGSPGMRQFSRKHDVLFWYSKGKTWTFNGDAVRLPHAHGGPSASGWGLSKEEAKEYGKKGKIPETYWIQSQGNGLAIAARQKKQYTGYPTQKPTALLNRIIEACSNANDIVLDPFCGCATTLVAAEQITRQWIGIDISPKAVDLLKQRLRNELSLLAYKETHLIGNTLPTRTDQGKIPPYNSPANKKWLYGEQDGYCLGCRTHFETRNLTIDHIVPKAKAGTDHISNLQLLCNSCNSIKGTLTNEEMIQRLIDKGYRKA